MVLVWISTGGREASEQATGERGSRPPSARFASAWNGSLNCGGNRRSREASSGVRSRSVSAKGDSATIPGGSGEPLRAKAVGRDERQVAAGGVTHQHDVGRIGAEAQRVAVPVEAVLDRRRDRVLAELPKSTEMTVERLASAMREIIPR